MLKNLARDILGQFINEPVAFGSLKTCHIINTSGVQHLDIQPRMVSVEHDRRNDGLDPACIGHADRGNLADAGMTQQYLVDFTPDRCWCRR